MTSIRSLLDEIFDQANPDSNPDTDRWYFYAERRGPQGWFAVPYESRWYYDAGEYLGKDGIEALETIKWLGFTVPDDIATKIKNKTISNRNRRKK